MELNRALIQGGAVEVVNNYILLTPETNLLEAIESFALFVLLPLSWRDHGDYINLRIIKEPGTRSHDEGLLLVPEPGPKDYGVPLRYAEVEALLKRWKLTGDVHSDALSGLLWQLLAEDHEAQRLLPRLVERWQRDFDGDPLLVGLARRIKAIARPDEPLVATFRRSPTNTPPLGRPSRPRSGTRPRSRPRKSSTPSSAPRPPTSGGRPGASCPRLQSPDPGRRRAVPRRSTFRSWHPASECLNAEALQRLRRADLARDRGAPPAAGQGAWPHTLKP